MNIEVNTNQNTFDVSNTAQVRKYEKKTFITLTGHHGQADHGMSNTNSIIEFHALPAKERNEGTALLADTSVTDWCFSEDKPDHDVSKASKTFYSRIAKTNATPGCTSSARKKSQHRATRKKCIFNGRKKIVSKNIAQVKTCSTPGCTSYARRKGVCVRHGAARGKCTFNGGECNNVALKNGVCTRHGAPRVRYFCRIPDCGKDARTGGVCYSHGAKRKICSTPECDNVVVMGGKCGRHHRIEKSKGLSEKNKDENESIGYEIDRLRTEDYSGSDINVKVPTNLCAKSYLDDTLRQQQKIKTHEENEDKSIDASLDGTSMSRCTNIDETVWDEKTIDCSDKDRKQLDFNRPYQLAEESYLMNTDSLKCQTRKGNDKDENESIGYTIDRLRPEGYSGSDINVKVPTNLCAKSYLDETLRQEQKIKTHEENEDHSIDASLDDASMFWCANIDETIWDEQTIDGSDKDRKQLDLYRPYQLAEESYWTNTDSLKCQTRKGNDKDENESIGYAIDRCSDINVKVPTNLCAKSYLDDTLRQKQKIKTHEENEDHSIDASLDDASMFWCASIDETVWDEKTIDGSDKDRKQLDLYRPYQLAEESYWTNTDSLKFQTRKGNDKDENESIGYAIDRCSDINVKVPTNLCAKSYLDDTLRQEQKIKTHEENEDQSIDASLDDASMCWCASIDETVWDEKTIDCSDKDRKQLDLYRPYQLAEESYWMNTDSLKCQTRKGNDKDENESIGYAIDRLRPEGYSGSDINVKVPTNLCAKSYLDETLRQEQKIKTHEENEDHSIDASLDDASMFWCASIDETIWDEKTIDCSDEDRKQLDLNRPYQLAEESYWMNTDSLKCQTRKGNDKDENESIGYTIDRLRPEGYSGSDTGAETRSNLCAKSYLDDTLRQEQKIKTHEENEDHSIDASLDDASMFWCASIDETVWGEKTIDGSDKDRKQQCELLPVIYMISSGLTLALNCPLYLMISFIGFLSLVVARLNLIKK